MALPWASGFSSIDIKPTAHGGAATCAIELSTLNLKFKQSGDGLTWGAASTIVTLGTTAEFEVVVDQVTGHFKVTDGVSVIYTSPDGMNWT